MPTCQRTETHNHCWYMCPSLCVVRLDASPVVRRCGCDMRRSTHPVIWNFQRHQKYRLNTSISCIHNLSCKTKWNWLVLRWGDSPAIKYVVLKGSFDNLHQKPQNYVYNFIRFIYVLLFNRNYKNLLLFNLVLYFSSLYNLDLTEHLWKRFV